MNKQLEDWVNFWKKVDNDCDHQIILNQINLIRKEAREERDKYLLSELAEVFSEDDMVDIRKVFNKYQKNK
jgi:hypothetical protein